MRQNRLSQRLKSKLDSFGFDALIKGVSTLVEENPEELEALNAEAEEQQEVLVAPSTEVKARSARTQANRSSHPTSGMYESLEEMEQRKAAEAIQAKLDMPLRVDAPPPLSAAPVTLQPDPVIAEEKGEVPAASAPAPSQVVVSEPVRTPTVSADSNKRAAAPEQLSGALEALSERLTQEAGSMAASLANGDVQDAGFYLAHINQILELLHTIDVKGDIARQLGVRNAPPPGRAWPRTAWTVVEFAESPFSALLPQNANVSVVREMIYAAWGIAFEHN